MMTETPDAEAAWEGWNGQDDYTFKESFLAGFAAGSARVMGETPLEMAAESLIKRVKDLEHELYGTKDSLKLVGNLRARYRTERDAASARVAEVEAEYKSLEVGYNAQVQHARKHYERADAARAELDSLRERLSALADEWEKYGRRPPEFMWASLRAVLVRGSDDE